MSDIRQKTTAVLHQMAEQMSKIPVLSESANDVKRLSQEVDEPCVVAVVGQVKAGKSTFINALLGEDLAKVGTTETTATINKFRYGNPDPSRPVRCHWRSGEITDEDLAFLNGLQGNDIETLQRADGVRYLEYLLPNPRLKQVTLVDTPGTNAAVDKHQNRTADYLKLHGQLRDRHNQETRRMGGEADAVIYLIGHVAGIPDQDFLDQFRMATSGQSQPHNAIGVISKIDLEPKFFNRWRESSARIVDQLNASLNTVIPVSAGVHRAVDHLCKNERSELTELMHALRRIPPDRLEIMLRSDAFFLDGEYDDCPVSVEERRRLYGDRRENSWAVFTTIARVAADPTLDQDILVKRLGELSGFDPLNQILKQRFFNRGHFLRCYRIVNDAFKILNRVKRIHIPELVKRKRKDEATLDRFLSFIRQSDGDESIAQELEIFLRERLKAPAPEEVETLRAYFDRVLSDLHSELDGYNADFYALQRLDEPDHTFSPAEKEELRHLLGLYGIDLDKRLMDGKATPEYVRTRQQAWRQIEIQAASEARREVAEQAYIRYGLILDEMNKGEKS